MILMKSFCTILIPTSHTKGVVVWDVFSNEDGSWLSYADPRVRQLAYGLESGKHPSSANIETARHFVGWLTNVTNYVGKLGRSGPQSVVEGLTNIM